MLPRVLVVEDDVALNRTIVAGLEAREMSATGVGTVSQARSLLDSGCWDAALIDVKLPDGEGVELLAETRRCRPAIPVILMTAFASVDRAVDAIRRGAADYLEKPFVEDDLVLRLKRVLDAHTRAESQGAVGFDRIIGQSQAMLDVLESGRRVARSDATTVLLTGESGTGKDLLARAIHEESKRGQGPFMNLTCTAIAEPLFESELFGHERGAFMGAQATKRGLLEIADGGTVFLDEVGDLPLELQAKLLRFLQDKSFKRVGGGRDITVDVRVIGATNQRLSDRIENGSFRADLYHRLKVIDIELPPLRARGDDLDLLANAVVAELGGSLGSGIQGLAPEALECMKRHTWPGNVRELRNVIERGLILGRSSVIEPKDLPVEIRSPFSQPAQAGICASSPGPVRAPMVLPEAGLDLERVERELLLAALARAKGNKTAAARLLGLNRDQVRYRLKKIDQEGPVLRGPATPTGG